MSSGKLLIGVFAGVAVGALAGILLAPDKGSKTRRKILSKGKDYIDRLPEKIDELVDSMSRKHETVKSETRELTTNGNEKYEDVKKGR